MRKLVDYEMSSGNVFRDLGLRDADELDIKANLAIEIDQIIARRGLSQVKAAAALGIDQPKVSPIVRGRLENSLWKNSPSSLMTLEGLLSLRRESCDARPLCYEEHSCIKTGRK